MQTTKKRQLPLFHIEEQESSPPTPTPWEKAGGSATQASRGGGRLDRCCLGALWGGRQPYPP